MQIVKPEDASRSNGRDALGKKHFMQADVRLLIIGSAEYRAAVRRAMPRAAGVEAGTPLAGVWESGQQPFDAVIVSLAAGQNVMKAVRSFRQTLPQARIIVTCPATEEPGARRALEAGADEYVLEPLTNEELHKALQLQERRAADAARLPSVPTWHEQTQFVDVLKNLHEGPQAALDRMAGLLAETFEVGYVAIEAGELVAEYGPAEPVVLEESIRRGESLIGKVALGRRVQGGFAAHTAARLADYARLIEAVITVAGDRVRWQELAWTDDLSRLRNRRYFERRLDELIAESARLRAQLTVLLFDIDDFKQYNDTYGHDTGDAVIQEIAALLLRCSRESDVVARYGGDEFAVILWDAGKPRVVGSKHPSDILALADRFRQAIATHAFACLGPQAPGPITISGGLASYPWDGHTRAQLLRAADEALLAAKKHGKDSIQLVADDPAPRQAKAPEVEE